jgi:alanine racemase
VKSWVEISGERLAGNYCRLVEVAGADMSVLAVIKADAYGHGAKLCAPVLARAGAEWLGVTDVTEGIAVRSRLDAEGISAEQQPRILVMSEALDEDFAAMLENRLTPVVGSTAQLYALEQAAQSRGARSVEVHLEVDTGMARQGVAPGADLEDLLAWFRDQNRVRLDGVMTHFASAEVTGSHQTTTQRQRFEQAIQQVLSSGLSPSWIHAGNSSTVDNQHDTSGTGECPLCWLRRVAAAATARPMVRAGLALYGYSQRLERERDYTGSADPLVGLELQPVMTWKARVTHIREVEAGTQIGYNGTFTARTPMRLALLPVGYADGLRRELSGGDTKPGGRVLFKSHAAAIVGRISINLMIVDVTGLSSIAVGDEAVLLGDGFTAEDHALIASTIPYDILCGVEAARRLVS